MSNFGKKVRDFVAPHLQVKKLTVILVFIISIFAFCSMFNITANLDLNSTSYSHMTLYNMLFKTDTCDINIPHTYFDPIKGHTIDGTFSATIHEYVFNGLPLQVVGYIMFFVAAIVALLNAFIFNKKDKVQFIVACSAAGLIVVASIFILVTSPCAYKMVIKATEATGGKVYFSKQYIATGIFGILSAGAIVASQFVPNVNVLEVAKTHKTNKANAQEQPAQQQPAAEGPKQTSSKKTKNQ